MEYDIFISYSRKDTSIVDKFYNALTDAGFKVWIDREGIYSGDQFTNKIPQAIRESKIVLFFSSTNSNASEWTIREISYSLSKRKTIIPIRLDNSEYADSIDFNLINIDYIPFHDNQLSGTIERLILSIRAHLSEQERALAPKKLISDGNTHYNSRNYLEAVKCYKLAAEQGHPTGQYNLGLCYYHGQGVTQDYNEAIKWFLKSSEQGFAEAHNRLGLCYYYGQGVTQDYEKAIEFYKKAVELGNPAAQFNLAVCYYYGQGTQQNHQEAIKWCRKAAEQDYVNAQFYLGVCYENGIGVTQNYQEAARWIQLAAHKHHITALYRLGYYYENGLGVEKNIEMSKRCYGTAAKRGDKDALEAIHRLGF